MTDVFFFLCDTFPCWQQKVKQILYFDKTNKNKLAYIIIIFSLCDTLCWQKKCKTNLILDKTNKINSLK